jgi:DNA-binding NarL/FixJ family response regulator
MTISVLLVDDHRLVREALRDVLAKESDIDIVGEASDASSAFERARGLSPDVVVLDVSLPDLSGIEAARRLRSVTSVDAKIVALAIHADRYFVTEMLRAGAVAYVTKSSAYGELVQAIRAAACGQTYVCPEVAELIVTSVRNGAERANMPHLSHRESEVLRLIAMGARSSAIAEQLHIAVGTVEVHRRNIARKLGARSVAKLTRYALREGLVAA